MPFITIEMPDSLQFELAPFAEGMHKAISSTLDIPIEKLKTKLVRYQDVFVGRGDPAHTYANIELSLMQGRDKEKLKSCLEALLSQFKEALAKQNPGLQCRVTVNVHELDRELLKS